MIEFIRMAGVVAVSFLVVASVRVLVDLAKGGAKRVREVREEGGGLVQKARGELTVGQRSPSTVHHGLHMVVRQGKLHYREKSSIAKEAA